VEILFLLVPLSLAIALAIGVVLWLAIEGGQFEDLEGPAIRVIADDDRPGRE
jgi:cbb3-type cytochrome oxidase maturation protein